MDADDQDLAVLLCLRAAPAAGNLQMSGTTLPPHCEPSRTVLESTTDFTVCCVVLWKKETL